MNKKRKLKEIIERKKQQSGQWEKEKRIPEFDEWINELRKETTLYAKELSNDIKYKFSETKFKEKMFEKFQEIFFLSIKNFEKINNFE
jgi:hypothetical protein